MEIHVLKIMYIRYILCTFVYIDLFILDRPAVEMVHKAFYSRLHSYNNLYTGDKQ